MSIPSLEDAYTTYLRPLLGAVGRLASQGYRIPPSDAMDLIHDFFLERWPSIARNYRPEDGPLFPYLYKSFIRFARTQIEQAQRREPLYLVDMDTLAAAELTESGLDAVQAALTQLPPSERSILKRYFGEEAVPQSGLKQELGISRHKVAERLAKALGRLLTYLEQPEWLAGQEWLVILSRWREGCTAQETAASLGLSRAQVEHAERRCLGYLTKALRFAGPRRRTTRSIDMDAGELFLKLLGATDDRELLAQIQDQADEVITRLQDRAFRERADLAFEKADENWAIEVYCALAGTGAEIDVEAQPAHAAEDREIGAAFAELYQGVREQVDVDLVDLRGAPVSDESFRALMSTPAVEAALRQEASVETLVRHGVAPLTVFYATEAVGGVFDRLSRYGDLAADSRPGLYVRDDRFEVRAGSLTSQGLCEEIVALAACDLDTAERLAIWITRVAMVRPHLVGTFFARRVPDGVEFEPSERSFATLAAQWARARALAPTREARIAEGVEAAAAPVAEGQEAAAAPVALPPREATLVRAVMDLSLRKFGKCIDEEMGEEKVFERVYDALLRGADIQHTYTRRRDGPNFIIGDGLMGVDVACCFERSECEELPQRIEARAAGFSGDFKKVVFLVYDARGHIDDFDKITGAVTKWPNARVCLVSRHVDST